jgi:hypothetical protein
MLVLLVVGCAVSASLLVNGIPAFDDLYLAARFEDLVLRYGHIGAVGVVFSGMDLAQEYRTYGLSRVLQLLLWGIDGGRGPVYALFVAASQLVTSVFLLQLLRERVMHPAMALAAALAWLVSPFAINWSFHHYSYLILPFQVAVAAAWLLRRATYWRGGYAVAVCAGFVCALTGEMHLLAAPVGLLALAWTSGEARRLRLTVVMLAAMGASIALHRAYWVAFIRNPSTPPRWQLEGRLELDTLLGRAHATWSSIVRALEMQWVELMSFGFEWAVPVGAATALAFVAAASRRRTDQGATGAATQGLLGAAFAFAGLAALALMVYVALAVLSGQVGATMPRRYGYVAFTLLTIAATFLVARLAAGLGLGVPAGAAAVIGVAAGLAAQVHLHAAPESRAADSALVRRMLEVRDLPLATGAGRKGIAYFISADPAYLVAEANAGTAGAKMQKLESIELLQSPFGYYWTAQHYAVNFLGFRFAAMAAGRNDDGRVRLGGTPYGDNPGNVRQEDVVVVANLGFERLDPQGRNVRVFRDFASFEPYMFGRAIDRNVFELGAAALDEVAIDLGLAAGAADGVLPDKRLGAAGPPMPQPWIMDYGWVGGADSVFVHPNVSPHLAYWRSNRHGAFTYAVNFRGAGRVRVSLDFWEQWGRAPGERVFDLEVSWDGMRWAEVATIDPAALNGGRPFSIVLERWGTSRFLFRLKPRAGARDVPVIQGLRLRMTKR